MSLGQLWYGWAPKGVEGRNREQIVAGSGSLDAPARQLTRQVLEWCYSTSKPSCGWVERGGVGVAFNRTPTGLDSAGRPGAFFVHALVWRSGQFPRVALGRLFEAPFWVTTPPSSPPAKLPVVESIDELALAETQSIDPELLHAVLAAVLANLARKRTTTLAMNQKQAMSLAGEVCQQFPGTLGLLSVSSYETEERSRAYDIVVADSGADSPVDSKFFDFESPSGRAAELLLKSAGGDSPATEVVSALADAASTPRAFSRMLHRWVAIDQIPLGKEGISETDHDFLAADGRLTLRLLQGPNGDAYARSLFESKALPKAMATIDAEGRSTVLIDTLSREIRSYEPSAALSILKRSVVGGPSLAVSLTVELAEEWRHDGRLDDLSARDCIDLLILLTDAPTAGSISALLGDPTYTSEITLERRLPVPWRVDAALANPDRVKPDHLIRVIAADQMFAQRFVNAGGEAGFEVLLRALRSVPPAQAVGCAEAIARLLPDPLRSKLFLEVGNGLSAQERFDLMRRTSPLVTMDTPWIEVMFDCLVEAVIATREGGLPLPAIPNLPPRAANDSRAKPWVRLGDQLSRGLYVIAADDLNAFDTRGQRSAALELVIDSACRTAPHGREWALRIRDVRSGTEESYSTLLPYLLRSLRRSPPMRRPELARWLITWSADRLDDGTLSLQLLNQEASVSLAAFLSSADRGPIKDLGKGRSKEARKWLKEIRPGRREERG